MRFQYSDASREVQRTVLLLASWLNVSNLSQLSYADPTPSLLQPPFYIEDNLRFPKVAMLLQSFLMVYEEKVAERSDFCLTLLAWGITYLTRELPLRHDALDSYRDASVKVFFSRKINRDQPMLLITNYIIKEFQ